MEHPVLTDEEHTARAMLMGMRYHHGNGEPFYYREDEIRSIDIMSMIDANTLEPFVQPVDHFMNNVVMKARPAINEDAMRRSLQRKYGGKNPWK